MIRKLVKYDFLSMGRILGPVYLVMLGLAALFGISVGRSITSQMGEMVSFTMLTSTAVLFAAAVFVGALVTLIMIIQNFYRNLLGIQGYLMFTLPVKTRTLVTAKGISGTLWVVFGAVSGILSFALIVLASGAAVDTSSFSSYYSERAALLSTPEIWVYVVQGILLALLAAAAQVMKIYASIAVGHLWTSHRAAGGILAYCGFSIIGVILMHLISLRGAVRNGTFDFFFGGDLASIGGMHMLLLYLSILDLVIVLIYWAIASWILTKKLNLQ